MKEQLENLIAQTLASLKQQNILPAEVEPRIQVTRTKDESHGDFASNIAMMLAKPCGKAHGKWLNYLWIACQTTATL